MITSTAYNGYSADVSMSLLVNGFSLPIAQMGGDFLLLDKSIDHPPERASIVLRVDASERRWDVHLPDGLVAGATRVAIALVKLSAGK